jgi:ABC-type bacteriocin/lantibiotic exporter with double-glycine peptidase domain
MNKVQVKQLFSLLEEEFKSVTLPVWSELPSRIWEFEINSLEDADELLNKIGAFCGIGFITRYCKKAEITTELKLLKGPLIIYSERDIHIFTIKSKGLVLYTISRENGDVRIIDKNAEDFLFKLIKSDDLEVLVPFKTHAGFTVPGKVKPTPWQRFWNFITGEKQTVLYLYFYAVIVGVVSLSLPLGIQSVIGLVSGGMLFDSVIVLISIVIIGVGITASLHILQIYMVELLQRRMFVKSAIEFSYKIPYIKANALEKRNLTEMVNRFYDVIIVQKGLPKILLDISAALFLFIFGIILLALYHFAFLVISLVLLVVMIIIIRVTAKKALNYSIKESKYKHLTVIWLERLSSSRNYFNAGPSFHGHMIKTDGFVGEYLKNRSKHFRVLMLQIVGLSVFKLLLTSITLIVGSILVVNKQITLGQFVAAEIVIILLISATEKLISNADVIYDVLTAFEKVGEVTDLDLFLPVGVKPFTNADSVLEIVVSENQKYVIKKGEHKELLFDNRKLANKIVKSLITENLNEEVKLKLNGFPANSYELGAFNQMIYGITKYDTIIRGSIFENVSLLLPEIDSKNILQTLEKCKLNNWISSLEDGIDSEIEPQEISIEPKILVRILAARILIHRPEFIITDNLFQDADSAFYLYFKEIIAQELPESAHLQILIKKDC